MIKLSMSWYIGSATFSYCIANKKEKKKVPCSDSLETESHTTSTQSWSLPVVQFLECVHPVPHQDG